MIYYLIKLFEGMISIYECTDHRQSVLKNMGEASQKFEDDVFWAWWRKKVEYQGEPSIFIIVTDQDQFDVPEDIQVAEIKNMDSLYNNPHLQDIPEDFNVISRPDNLALISRLPKTSREKCQKTPRNDHSLEDYFVQEMARLRA